MNLQNRNLQGIHLNRKDSCPICHLKLTGLNLSIFRIIYVTF